MKINFAGHGFNVKLADGTPIDFDSFPPGSLKAEEPAFDRCCGVFEGTFTFVVDDPWNYLRGIEAGYQGVPRDWSRGDAWHRGYLRGRLSRMKGASD